MRKLSILALLLSCTVAGAVEIRPQKELRELEEAIKSEPGVSWQDWRFLSFGATELADLAPDRRTTKMVVMTVTKSDKGMDTLMADMRPRLLALNIKELGWTPAMWEEMSREWVYYKGLQVPESVMRSTGSRFPIMRSDVFVQEAWKSKWYTQLLNLPTSRQKLY